MDMVLLADHEDEWDKILSKRCGLECAQDGNLWATPFLEAAGEVSAKRRIEDGKMTELAKKMFEIVMKEKALAERERVEREAIGNLGDKEMEII